MTRATDLLGWMTGTVLVTSSDQTEARSSTALELAGTKAEETKAMATKGEKQEELVELEDGEACDVTVTEETEGKGLSVKRWARGISPAHEKALAFLEGRELAVLRRGLSALAKIAKLQKVVDSMADVRAKLDRKVEA